MIAQSSYNYDARIVRYCKALRENGAEIHVICLRFGDQYKSEEIDGIKIFRIMKAFNQDTIFTYIYFSLIFLIKAFFAAFALIRRNEYSIIHIHNMPDYLVFSAIPARMRRIPVLLDIHDLTVELFKEKWSENKFSRFKFILKFSERLSCNFADEIITVTNECIDKLADRGIDRNKISLIMNSPDETSFTFNDSRFLNYDKDNFKILYNGTVAKRFGLHYTVRAMKDVIKSFPGTQFHIYGNIINSYTAELEELSEMLDISGNIFFHSLVPYNHINDLLKSYDLAVVTYEQTEYMNLAFPTKTGEYALAGLPFIMSDLKSVRNIFGSDSTIYVDPGDTDNLAACIMDLLNNPQKRRMMSYNAYEDIQKIKWELMKERYIDLVDKITQKKKLEKIK